MEPATELETYRRTHEAPEPLTLTLDAVMIPDPESENKLVLWAHLATFDPETKARSWIRLPASTWIAFYRSIRAVGRNTTLQVALAGVAASNPELSEDEQRAFEARIA